MLHQDYQQDPSPRETTDESLGPWARAEEQGKGHVRVLQRRYFSPTSRCRSSIPNRLSPRCIFFWSRSRSPVSPSERFRLCGESSDMACWAARATRFAIAAPLADVFCNKE